ncbi:MAG TPA: hypothetical protein VEH58_01405, partial [Dehalococcoidales bacterium]|nr:hypothetical protein [Dehalococcoidales bacterium]
MEKTTIKYKKLFESVSIGKLKIANRFVMPPMVTDYGDSSGFVTDKLVNYYQERAKYQVGLVVVEATCVAPGGRVQVNQLRIDDNKFLPGLSKLAENIHQAGAKCFIQLHHGGRAANPKYNLGLQPVAPSPVARRDGTIPCELTICEIERIIEAFVQGAKKAKEAGFDGIELHFAHNYLIQQFLSPL